MKIILLNIVNFLDHNPKTNIVIGDIVKVLSPSFKDYYRAEIVSSENNDSFYVFYIDFGNKELVKSSDIVELEDNLRKKVLLNRFFF